MSVIRRLSSWQDSRAPWALLSFVSVFLVILAHSFFQNYLYMQPCEQCVYIRFAFLCMALGGIFSVINPKILPLKIATYTLCIYGAIWGVIYSLRLVKIHAAIHTDDPFGVQGCNMEPTYPFNLPLQRLSPELFLPTGYCGQDSPMVPDDIVLSSIQNYFINLYSDGWYLVPSKQLFSMGHCTLFGFVACLVVLVLLLLSKFITLFNHNI